MAVIEHLRLWREEIIERLRHTDGDAATLSCKLEIELAIQSLEFCAAHQITPAMQAHRLPKVELGYGEARVVWDCDTEDRAWWQEVRDGDEPLRAIPGDLLLCR